jgi:5-methylcytosine-specific restriction endonuclease McrA/transposase
MKVKYTRKPKFNREIYTKEWLYEQFWVKNLTRKQIAEIIGCTKQTVTQMLKENNMTRAVYPIKPEKLRRGITHPKFCKKTSQATIQKNKVSATLFDRTIYSKEWLCEKYYTDNLSANQISIIIGSSRVFITKLMKEYGIKARTVSEAFKIDSNRKPPPIKRGVENHGWKGGITPLYKKIRECNKYKFWRKNVFIKDNYICIECESGKNIQADHIKSFALIIESNNITTLEQALDCEELWDINNGRTLCKKCHEDTETFGHGTKVLLNELRASKSSVVIDADTIDSIGHNNIMSSIFDSYNTEPNISLI